MPAIDQILETALYVNDIDEAGRFYSALLQIKPYSKDENRHIFFRVGTTMLLLFKPETTRQGGPLPPHGAVGDGHVAFSVKKEELEFWRKHLDDLGIVVEMEYSWPSGGKSVYFRDPSNNSVEFVTPDTWP